VEAQFVYQPLLVATYQTLALHHQLPIGVVQESIQLLEQALVQLVHQEHFSPHRNQLRVLLASRDHIVHLLVFRLSRRSVFLGVIREVQQRCARFAPRVRIKPRQVDQVALSAFQVLIKHRLDQAYAQIALLGLTPPRDQAYAQIAALGPTLPRDQVYAPTALQVPIRPSQRVQAASTARADFSPQAVQEPQVVHVWVVLLGLTLPRDQVYAPTALRVRTSPRQQVHRASTAQPELSWLLQVQHLVSHASQEPLVVLRA